MLWIDILKLRLRARFNKDMSPEIVELTVSQMRALAARREAAQAQLTVTELQKAGRMFASRNMNQSETMEFLIDPRRPMPLTPEFEQAEAKAKQLELEATNRLISVLQLLKKSGLPQSHPLHQSIAQLVELSGLK